MGGLFSKKNNYQPNQNRKVMNNCEITDRDQAALQLKSTRNKIKQYIKRKEKCSEKETELARQLIREGKKDKALLLLKKKKYSEGVIDQALAQLDNVEKLIQDLEMAEMQKQVVESLRQGNDALKKMNTLFDLDEIDRIMEETKEGAEYQAEITAMLSGQLSQNEVEDVERELDELLANETGEKLPDVPAAKLPEVEQGEDERPEEVSTKPERVMVEA